jgi:hypothetical protein
MMPEVVKQWACDRCLDEARLATGFHPREVARTFRWPDGSTLTLVLRHRGAGRRDAEFDVHPVFQPSHANHLHNAREWIVSSREGVFVGRPLRNGHESVLCGRRHAGLPGRVEVTDGGTDADAVHRAVVQQLLEDVGGRLPSHLRA